MNKERVKAYKAKLEDKISECEACKLDPKWAHKIDRLDWKIQNYQQLLSEVPE